MRTRVRRLTNLLSQERMWTVFVLQRKWVWDSLARFSDKLPEGNWTPPSHGFAVPLASRVFSFPCWALWGSCVVLLVTLSVKRALEWQNLETVAGKDFKTHLKQILSELSTRHPCFNFPRWGPSLCLNASGDGNLFPTGNEASQRNCRKLH